MSERTDDESDNNMAVFLSLSDFCFVWLLIAGEKHELLPATENKPGIVVHICGEQPEGNGCKQRICQTPCPKRIWI